MSAGTGGRGRYQIEESIGVVSGDPIFTVQYQPADPAPGFPLWEDVASYPTRELAEGRIREAEEVFREAVYPRTVHDSLIGTDTLTRLITTPAPVTDPEDYSDERLAEDLVSVLDWFSRSDRSPRVGAAMLALAGVVGGAAGGRIAVQIGRTVDDCTVCAHCRGRPGETEGLGPSSGMHRLCATEARVEW